MPGTAGRTPRSNYIALRLEHPVVRFTHAFDVRVGVKWRLQERPPRLTSDHARKGCSSAWRWHPKQEAG